MSRSLDAFLAALRGEIGVVERPVNRVKYNTAFYGSEVSGDRFPWCQVLPWWAGIRAGISAVLPSKTASTINASDQFKARGAWGRQPRPGAYVFYDWGHGIAHVGVCESGLLPGNYFAALEGNTGRPGQSQDNGGMVLRQARAMRALGPRGGFGYPNYAAADAIGGAPGLALTPSTVSLSAGLARRPDVLPVLTRGASGGWVSLAQQCLGTAVDGSAGPIFDSEVRDQQAQYGLVIDGALGAWTWISFVADAGANLRAGQAKGHPGLEVLQNLLGYRGGDLDRSFGPSVTGRVMQVQRWAGLEPDGVVGPATRAALTRG